MNNGIKIKYDRIIKENVELHDMFYKIKVIKLSYKNEILYDRNNVDFYYGSNFDNLLPNEVYPEVTYQIAYVENDMVKEIFTNREVIVAHDGMNIINNNQLLISDDYELISKDEICNIFNINKGYSRSRN